MTNPQLCLCISILPNLVRNVICVTGGAGGKGVWGKPGSELGATGVCNDMRDPNYDSDSQVIFLLLCRLGNALVLHSKMVLVEYRDYVNYTYNNNNNNNKQTVQNAQLTD